MNIPQIQPSDARNFLMQVVAFATSDPYIFIGIMVGIFVLFFWFTMRKGLNLDDKLHHFLTEVFLTLLFFGLLIMANNGVLPAFIKTLTV